MCAMLSGIHELDEEVSFMRYAPSAVFALSSLTLSLCAPSAFADDYSNALSADHPGFADASSTVGASRFQAEFGIEAAGSVIAPNLLARYGLSDPLELRLDIPGVGIDVGDGGALGFSTFELGAKYSIPISDTLQIGILPFLVVPTFLDDLTRQTGGAVSAIADISLGKVGLTAQVTTRVIRTRVLPVELGPVTVEVDPSTNADFAFALGAGTSITEQLGVFLEAWATLAPNDPVLDTDLVLSPALNGGVTYYINPDILLDAYIGATDLGEGNALYGGVGFIYRM